MLATVLPLVVALAGGAGLAAGALMARRTHEASQRPDLERRQDEIAKRAARKAVAEVLARLR